MGGFSAVRGVKVNALRRFGMEHSVAEFAKVDKGRLHMSRNCSG